KDNGQFINLVTMQNHMPYNKDYYSDNTDFAVEQAVELDDEIREQINNFATGIHYTDGYVADFIEQLEAIDKPITLVFYGDHLPGIYANDMAKDGLNLHETDYFIYSNKVAREQGAKTDLVKSRYISPNDFPAMVSEATNSKISPYYALLTSVYQTLPAFYIGSESNSTSVRNVEYVTEAEKLVSEKNLTEEQKEILNDLRVIQYDITAGKNYVKDTDFMKIQSSYGDE
ncbi:sulfatase-like hydrolase/transferase, partial [Ligilactobacillus animalis]